MYKHSRFHFPFDKAAKIAVQSARDAIARGDITNIFFVCFDEWNFDEYKKEMSVRA
jgi:O-acetyl-ADP-ribose deacetylase (regulator of RNase III)